MTDDKDWTIDLTTRTVKHISGAEATFYPYHSEQDWLETDVANCLNPYLYPDGEAEFARRAKQVAIARGMKHDRS